jgi:hypothetical protein
LDRWQQQTQERLFRGNRKPHDLLPRRYVSSVSRIYETWMPLCGHFISWLLSLKSTLIIRWLFEEKKEWCFAHQVHDVCYKQRLVSSEETLIGLHRCILDCISRFVWNEHLSRQVTTEIQSAKAWHVMDIVYAGLKCSIRKKTQNYGVSFKNEMMPSWSVITIIFFYCDVSHFLTWSESVKNRQKA